MKVRQVKIMQWEKGEREGKKGTKKRKGTINIKTWREDWRGKTWK